MVLSQWGLNHSHPNPPLEGEGTLTPSPLAGEGGGGVSMWIDHQAMLIDLRSYPLPTSPRGLGGADFSHCKNRAVSSLKPTPVTVNQRPERTC